MPETVGITDERWDEIANTINGILRYRLLAPIAKRWDEIANNGIVDDYSETEDIDAGIVLEYSLNKIDPESIVEAAIIGYLIAKGFSKAERNMERAFESILTEKILRDMQR